MTPPATWPATLPATPPAAPADATLPAADYAFLVELLAAESGLALVGDKRYLLRTRLGEAAARWGNGTLRGLAAALRAEAARRPAGARPAARAVGDAMTTNETLFFRDGAPFDALRDVILPAAAARRAPGGPLPAGAPVRVWCAAASTGQEPYSVAVCALQAAPALHGLPVEILATDYSDTALGRARAGVYTALETRRGLPPAVAAQYFEPAADGGLRAGAALRRLVRFERRNLLEPFAGVGPFDVICCRNVLLYFDTPTKRDVLDRLADALAPGGVLLLGGTETPLGVTRRLARVAGLPAPAYARAAA